MVANATLATVIAYLLGSIPTGYIVARLARGVDIREVGDRYSGAKNVFREIGLVAGVATAVGDMAKGALAILQTRLLPVPEAAKVWIGLAAVAGHIWPVFLQFRGGAGLATSVGVVLAALSRESLILFVPYLALAATLGRRIGLGATSALLLIPLTLLSRRLKEPTALVTMTWAIAVLVAARVYHREIEEALRRCLVTGERR